MRKSLILLFLALAYLGAQKAPPTVQLGEIRVQGQKGPSSLQDIEEDLLKILEKMATCPHFECILAQNADFKKYFSYHAQNNAAFFFAYPFAKLQKKLRILSSADKKIRIFNWSLPHDQGQHQFFAYLLVQNPKGNFQTFFLKEMDAKRKHNSAFLLQKVLDTKAWYGALYSQLIEKTVGGKNYYFLIGSEGFEAQTHRKVIDVLHFEAGQPFWGAPLFFIDKKTTQHRYLLEFMPGAHVALRYETALDALVMDQLTSFVPELDFSSFRVPNGHFNLFFWKGKGFYLLENFLGEEVLHPKKMRMRHHEKFVREEAVFVPKVEKSSKKSPKALYD